MLLLQTTSSNSSAFLLRCLLSTCRGFSFYGMFLHRERRWIRSTTGVKSPASPATPSARFRVPSVPSCGSSSNTSAGVKSGNVDTRNENWQMFMVGSFAIYYKISPLASGIRLKRYSLSADIHFNERKYQIDSISRLMNTENPATSSSSKNTSKSQHQSLTMLDCQSEMDMYSSLPTEFGKKRKDGRAEKPHSVPINFKYAAATKVSDYSTGLQINEPFDICLSGSINTALEASLYARTEEINNEAENMEEFTKPIILRQGMVLLKHYVTLKEQVEIVEKCRKLGLGPGGFYQPGYNDGAKLRLQMMCLGLNWDPQTRKYEQTREIDGTRPPGIPDQFSLLVERAIREAQAGIKEISRVEEILPSMSPDICIANFYTTSGRLGLHQDRDESRKSLREGLPVVSVSIGDSADFFFGNQRDIGKADSVVLESGDVLIFGGPSRHIFHGVTSILPNSAPMKLLEETGLRPGRLNLTFRQN